MPQNAKITWKTPSFNCIHSVEKEGRAWIRACACEQTNTVHNVAWALSHCQSPMLGSDIATMFTNVVWTWSQYQSPMFTQHCLNVASKLVTNVGERHCHNYHTVLPQCWYNVSQHWYNVATMFTQRCGNVPMLWSVYKLITLLQRCHNVRPKLWQHWCVSWDVWIKPAKWFRIDNKKSSYNTKMTYTERIPMYPPSSPPPNEPNSVLKMYHHY